MKVGRCWYTPEIDVEFTRAEVEALFLYSDNHYDFFCRMESNQYGILRDMRNMFEGRPQEATITYRLNIEKADLLAKIAESDPALSAKLVIVVRTLNAKWKELNCA
jgi:hypothetical protein